jgi:hypothetical protein
MDQNEKFPWTLLFLVKAVSFLGFGALIKFIGGLPSHYSLFFKISIGAVVIAVVSFCTSLSRKPTAGDGSMKGRECPDRRLF